jgi:thymidylate synthase (FAD)
MKVKLIAHTELSDAFLEEVEPDPYYDEILPFKINPRAAVALSAIRTCYSPGLPSEIVKNEGAKYFGSKATDGDSGSEADRLMRHIVNSGHTSTLEHISYVFAVEGVSRSLLAQLSRHRVGVSLSVQSQRYVRFGSGDKSGGFDYVTPPKILEITNIQWDADRRLVDHTAKEIYEGFMGEAQRVYDALRAAGVPAEDARFVLPNAATCNFVLTVNLTALLSFYSKRRKGRGAQWEIADLAEELRAAVVAVDPWTGPYFEKA